MSESSNSYVRKVIDNLGDTCGILLVLFKQFSKSIIPMEQYTRLLPVRSLNPLRGDSLTNDKKKRGYKFSISPGIQAVLKIDTFQIYIQ